MLRVLPTKFDALVIAIEETKDLTQLTMDELHASLINHEYRMNKSHTSIENAFSSQASISRGKGRGRFTPRGRGRNSFRGHSNSPTNQGGRGHNNEHFQTHPSGQRQDKSHVQCYYCKKYGHYSFECRKKQHDQGRQNQNSPENSTKTMFIACAKIAEAISTKSPVERNMVQESPNDIWYLDSGCSNHMSRNLELFSSLDKSVTLNVTLRNNNQVNVMGKDIVDTLPKKGEQKIIYDFFYVAGLKHNLMSIGQLVHK